MESSYVLELESYCNGCPEFLVHVVEDTLYVESGYGTQYDRKIITRAITCKHKKRCENLIKYLTKKIEKETKDD